jgi:hypothetical protein
LNQKNTCAGALLTTLNRSFPNINTSHFNFYSGDEPKQRQDLNRIVKTALKSLECESYSDPNITCVSYSKTLVLTEQSQGTELKTKVPRSSALNATPQLLKTINESLDEALQHINTSDDADQTARDQNRIQVKHTTNNSVSEETDFKQLLAQNFPETENEVFIESVIKMSGQVLMGSFTTPVAKAVQSINSENVFAVCSGKNPKLTMTIVDDPQEKSKKYVIAQFSTFSDVNTNKTDQMLTSSNNVERPVNENNRVMLSDCGVLKACMLATVIMRPREQAPLGIEFDAQAFQSSYKLNGPTPAIS